MSFRARNSSSPPPICSRRWWPPSQVPLALNVDRRAQSELGVGRALEGGCPRRPRLRPRCAGATPAGWPDVLAGATGDRVGTVVVDGDGLTSWRTPTAAVLRASRSRTRSDRVGAASGRVAWDIRRAQERQNRRGPAARDQASHRGRGRDRRGCGLCPDGRGWRGIRSSWLRLAVIGVAVVAEGLVLGSILAGSVALSIRPLAPPCHGWAARLGDAQSSRRGSRGRRARPLFNVWRGALRQPRGPARFVASVAPAPPR